MKIIMHGAAGEIGKSCIEVQSQGKRYIMDAGIKFTQTGPEYPKYLDKIHNLDAVFISHAHLDHSGALPMLEHKNLQCPIYMTPLTWKITNLLLEDSYHLEKLKHVHPAYVERDIRKIKKDLKFVNYDKTYETPDKLIKFDFINSGHIPGGASILLDVEGKKVLYTADINTEESLLMVESELDKLDMEIDVLITENTYGDRPHPPREISEEGLLKSIKECIHENGTVLIPVFSVGRSQEILMLLSKLDIDAPIYLDGMPRKLTQIFVESDDPYIKNKDLLAKMYKKATIVSNPRDRSSIAKKKGAIIVTSSGMVQGGPVISYCETIIHNEQDYILLTGYQAKGTNGRHMLEDHMFYSNHKNMFVKSHVRKFDFSAHHGQESIRKLMTKLKPKNIILQHGDMNALEESKKYAEKMLPNTKVYLPMIGEEMEF